MKPSHKASDGHRPPLQDLSRREFLRVTSLAGGGFAIGFAFSGPELLAQAGSSDPEAHARLAATTIHSLSIRARAGATREELRRLARDVSAMIVAASEPVR